MSLFEFFKQQQKNRQSISHSSHELHGACRSCRGRGRKVWDANEHFYPTVEKCSLCNGTGNIANNS